MPMTADALAQAARELAAAGLMYGTAGNISLRTDTGFSITGTGVRLARTAAADIVAVNPDGTARSGGSPSSETGLHRRLYERTDAVAIVHTHSAATVAVGILTEELPCLHYQQLGLGGATPVVPFHVFGSSGLAEAVVTAIGTGSAVLLAHHGAVVTGYSLDDAIEKTYLLEWACDIYLRACAAGRPEALTPQQQQSVIDTVTRTGYGTPTRPDPPTTGSTPPWANSPPRNEDGGAPSPQTPTP